MRKLKDFDNLSDKPIEVYYIICVCGKKIYLSKKQAGIITCFKCKSKWKINYPMKTAFGKGENKGVHLLFGSR